MSQDAERMKSLISLKEKLEKRIERLSAEMNEQQILLKTINSILLEKGFKRAEIKAATPEAKVHTETESPAAEPMATEAEDVVPLKTGAGELLAILHVRGDSLRVLPSEGKEFNVNTPPFTQFLVERVFTKMQEKDAELVRSGQLLVGKMFSYTVVQENDVINEIIINNIDPERLKELKSSIRWTLEKMYEKMQDQG